MLRFFCNPLMLQENVWYGHSQVVKNIGGSGFGARIEHGVFFAEDTTADLEGVFTPLSVMFFRLKRVYTYSARRRDLVLRYLGKRGLRIEVIALGPYIKYARHFMPETRLKELKNRLGRVLLVYPQHSTETVVNSYDNTIIHDYVAKLRVKYDTVLVSLYWADIFRGMARWYEQAGYKVVCSGVREDPYFLSRQKDLMYLADRVLTNSVGTHIGYALAMGKPCTLFRQEISTIVGNDDELRNVNGSKRNIGHFFPAFASEEGGITDEQRRLVEEFWGPLK